MEKKKKTGHIALPYLLTIFFGILIIGGGTYFFLRYLGVLDDNNLSEPPSREVTTTTYADNHTILFILDEPGEVCSTTFMLMRSIPKDKKIIFMGIPSNTIENINGDQVSMRSSYEKGGITSAVSFAEYVLGIKIDRYIKLNSESLIKICDIMGGVSYRITEDIKILDGDGTNKTLTSSQIEKLMLYTTSPLNNEYEPERAYLVSSVSAAMLNQADGDRIADNLDTSFNSIVNICDTDITVVDYRNYKVAIKEMLKNGNAIASPRELDGNLSYDDFLASKSFLEDFRKQYFSYDEGEKNSNG